MKKLNSTIKFLAILLYGYFVLYQLYGAGVYGEIAARGVSPDLESSPFKFWLVVSVYILILAVVLLLLGLNIGGDINRRFKKHGGSYNLKTALHVFSDVFGKDK
ncbi:hypothetical protein [Agarivorans litoreus]|uniref:hypothetical protein n=1 Tax=Agarivorans litoreus TaxID=1510455 RepID=UPI001C7D62A2|nr:hypothetical protein [Agarivorans litoreus]